MKKTKDLIVKEINFHQKKILAVRDEEKIYVSVKSICNNLGMSKSQADNQIQKVQNDGLFQGACNFKHLETNGGTQKVLLLELDYLPIWLAKINPSRFSDELKKELMNYQLNAKDVLADAFLGHRTKEISVEHLPVPVSIPQVMIPIGKSVYWEELKKLAESADELRINAHNRIMRINHNVLLLNDDIDNLRNMAKKVEELIEKIEI